SWNGLNLMKNISQMKTQLTLLSFLIFCAKVSCTFAQNRPNILIIIADDMGTDAFGAYNIGTDLPSTPNLDKLMGQGLLFTNAWAYPTCAPSRASMLTGRYGNKNGITRSGLNLRNAETSLFEQLEVVANNEYSNALFGKWHLGGANSPNNQGIQHYDGNLTSGVDDYFNWERTINGVTDTSSDYVTTYITDQAINWIDNQDQPWLLWMAYNAPHSPFHLPPDSLYTRTETSSQFDQYMCMIESVDHEVGRLYNSMSQEEKENTIIFFMGDNGTPNGNLQGYPRRHGKGTLYEGGIRVPMFVTGFGVNRVNEQETAMVSFTDVFATIIELLGTDLPGGIDNSFSFFPLLMDSNAPKRTYNYSELEDEDLINRAIRNEQYKLITNEDGSREFYDLINDPLETNELLANGISQEQMQILDQLQVEADSIFTSWSCNDAILNGDEQDIDCGGSACSACSITSYEEAFEEDILSVFPNPTENELNISLKKGLYTIRILDLAGAVLKRIEDVGDKVSFDLEELPKGIFFIKVTNLKNYKTTTTKILKQ
ncbi:MAG: sulfatase-like hydrolase/transferase, partial [Bacteroidota bacterium]